jgi:hypothetical protein
LNGVVIDPVGAVPRDGHDVSPAGHDVTERSQVPVVDVESVRGKAVSHFVHDCLSRSLNAKCFKHFDDVIACRSGMIYIAVRHDLHEVRSICFENPL